MLLALLVIRELIGWHLVGNRLAIKVVKYLLK